MQALIVRREDLRRRLNIATETSRKLPHNMSSVSRLAILQNELEDCDSSIVELEEQEKKLEAASIKKEELDISQTKSGKAAMPIKKAQGFLSSKNLTDLSIFNQSKGSLEIWDFERRTWQPWNPKIKLASARSLLWKCAQKILKVIYFSNHQCTAGELEKYISKSLVDEVFSQKDWAELLGREKRLYHNRILSESLQNVILPRWKEVEGYPALNAAKHPETQKAERMQFFQKQAMNDGFAIERFFAPLGESIDWKRIAEAATPQDLAAYRWGVYCLATAADIVYQLGPERSADLSKKRNKAWEELARINATPPCYEITLVDHFGCGRRGSVKKGEVEPVSGSPVLRAAEWAAVPPEDKDEEEDDWELAEPQAAPSSSMARTVKRRRTDNELSVQELEIRNRKRLARNNPTAYQVFRVDKNDVEN